MASAEQIQKLYDAMLSGQRVTLHAHTDPARQQAGDRIAKLGGEQFECTKDQVEDLQASGAQQG